MQTIYNIDPSIFARAEFNEERDANDEGELSFNDTLSKMTRNASTKAKATVKVAKEKTQRVNKSSRALDIYKSFNGDKALTIGAYMSELSMSKAGATTYFYNAKKAA